VAGFELVMEIGELRGKIVGNFVGGGQKKLLKILSGLLNYY
jgi:hypothetical protein